MVFGCFFFERWGLKISAFAPLHDNLYWNSPKQGYRNFFLEVALDKKISGIPPLPDNIYWNSLNDGFKFFFQQVGLRWVLV